MSVLPYEDLAGQEFLEGAASGSGDWHFPSVSDLVVAGADACLLFNKTSELAFSFPFCSR